MFPNFPLKSIFELFRQIKGKNDGKVVRGLRVILLLHSLPKNGANLKAQDSRTTGKIPMKLYTILVQSSYKAEVASLEELTIISIK